MTAPDTALRALRHAAPDLALGAIGGAWGAISWWFPFGRDQGLFYYVGREWLERGAIPYRDVFEQKTPLIFFVNGLLERVFGQSMVPIHVVEWLLIGAIGLMTVRLVVPEGTAAPRGAYGASVLLCHVFFYGFFTYQEVANCESWVVFFVAASTLAARCIGRTDRAASIAGLLAGLAVLAKPPAVLLLPLPAYELLARGWQPAPHRRGRAVRAIALFGAGTVAVNAMVVLYFALHHAFPAMVDVLVRANAYYNTHERPSLAAWDLYLKMLDGYQWFEPYSTLLLVVVGLGVGVPLLRGDRARAWRYGKPAVVLVLAYATMFVQLKFLLYHFEVLLLPVALFGTTLYGDLHAVATSRRGRRLVAPSFAVAAIGFFWTSGWAKDAYVQATRTVVGHLIQSTPEMDVLGSFSTPGDIDLPDSALAGEWVAAHSSPDDTLLVRGYEPQVYFFARRHYTGRFFYSAFITLPWRAYRRRDFLAEDYAAFLRHPPRFVVSFSDARYDIDNTRWFTARGYEKRAAFGHFDVLELVHPEALSHPATGVR